MRFAIYVRYSSANQSKKSIDDQIKVFQKYIEAHGFLFSEKQIYVDEAISGLSHHRPGLLALEKAIVNKEVDAVAVDDLSTFEKQLPNAQADSEIRLLPGQDHLHK